MIRPYVYEGTAEEIADKIRQSKLVGKFRAIVTPEDGFPANGSEEPVQTLADRLKGRVGLCDFGDANLSENTGRKFAEILDEKHRKEQL